VDRSSNAPLSPMEVASLRRVASGRTNEIPEAHRTVLTAMTLVERVGDSDLVLTDLGRHRLEGEGTKSPRGVESQQPVGDSP
jgi:hypothetical protein